ncbi:NUDIX hydrolase [Pseudonocardia spinosispora]|uniref:NUDIX hydrolase n=1 Tax=Pseudonocardia spinosispora TaxID=103441 RepID=UPI000400D491|nr:NUDIX hydrolase [Pseudonocardia spinosispora]
MPPGDGWAYCALGHKHWGLFGAAGLLLRHRAPDGTDWLLMQHRSWWSHHGGTWGLLGGARMPSETAEQAAGREAWEEAALPEGSFEVTGTYVDDHGGWSYVTVVGEAAEMVPVEAATSESKAVEWVRLDRVPGLELHPGFAATWPTVAELLAS